MEFLIPQVYQMKELILKRNLLSLIFKYYKKNTTSDCLCAKCFIWTAVVEMFQLSLMSMQLACLSLTDRMSCDLTDRSRWRCKVTGSSGGTRSQRRNRLFTWDCSCPLGGAAVSINSCGSTTPATSPTSKTPAPIAEQMKYSSPVSEVILITF